jgi:predicted nucleic acid-binding protein
MNLVDALPNSGAIAFDTAPLIYLIEPHPRYVGAVSSVISQRIQPGVNQGLTSVVTIAEVLVLPLKLGRQDIVDSYRQAILKSRNFDVFDVTLRAAERAALLRARYSIRLPDAFQLAVAIEHNAVAFLTNDHRFQRVTELSVFCLDDYAP